jgi:hypothetical protein
MSERLELVVDFESLRSGDDIVVLACDCGEIFCRSQLTIFHPGAGMLGPGWFSEPRCRLPGSDVVLIVGVAAVRSGCLFRVVGETRKDQERRGETRKASGKTT